MPFIRFFLQKTFFTGCFLVGLWGWGQPSLLEGVNDTLVKDDLGEVSDAFQDLFFKAVAQYGIENYEQAIETLKKSMPLAPDPTVIHYQLGKNYWALNKFDEAIKAWEKVQDKRPEDQELLALLFEAYRRQGKLDKAIEMGAKLAPKNSVYFLKLAKLWLRKQNEEEALQNIAAFEQVEGGTREVDSFRQQIYRETKQPEKLMQYLQKQSQKEPLNPQNFKALIYLYHLYKKPDKAYLAALALQELDKEAREVPLGLYPHYIEAGETDLAVSAFKKLLSNRQDEQLNTKVLEDFKQLVKKHPQYKEEWDSRVSGVQTEEQLSNRALAEQYQKEDPQKALTYYRKALEETPQNFNLLQETLLLQMQEQAFEEALTLALQALEYFPTQAVFYLIKGKAENALGNYEQAEQSLTEGVGMVIDHPSLLEQFYQALEETYKNLGQDERQNYYKEQLKTLKN